VSKLSFLAPAQLPIGQSILNTLARGRIHVITLDPLVILGACNRNLFTRVPIVSSTRPNRVTANHTNHTKSDQPFPPQTRQSPPSATPKTFLNRTSRQYNRQTTSRSQRHGRCRDDNAVESEPFRRAIYAKATSSLALASSGTGSLYKLDRGESGFVAQQALGE
jgi:hypothetical protein